MTDVNEMAAERLVRFARTMEIAGSWSRECVQLPHEGTPASRSSGAMVRLRQESFQRCDKGMEF